MSEVRVVPVEPTEAMFREALRDGLSEERARAIWTHMLAASPAPAVDDGMVERARAALNEHGDESAAMRAALQAALAPPSGAGGSA